MPIDIDFLLIAKWSGILTLGLGAIAILGFFFQWGIRFRLVGIAGFMAVLTGGFVALVLGLSSHTTVPGSVRYTVVFDNGATKSVITVPAQITESELEATLKEAASNLFSYGRLGQGKGQFIVRARTILHPEPGLSQLLYLGQARRFAAASGDEAIQVEVDRDAIAKLPAPTQTVD